MLLNFNLHFKRRMEPSQKLAVNAYQNRKILKIISSKPRPKPKSALIFIGRSFC